MVDVADQPAEFDACLFERGARVLCPLEMASPRLATAMTEEERRQFSAPVGCRGVICARW